MTGRDRSRGDGAAPKTRVVLACSPHLFGSALAESLGHFPGVDARAAGADGKDVERLVDRHRPHVVLVDWATYVANGANGGVFSRVAAKGVAHHIVLLASASETDEALIAMRDGAWGVVYLDAEPAQLAALVEAAAAGQRWEDQEYAAHVVRSVRDRGAASARPTGHGPTLSARERQLIAELAAGASNADIALTLGLRPQTVKNRLSAIFDKLGVSSRLELALYAVNHHLMDRPEGGGPPPRRKKDLPAAKLPA